MKEPARSGHDGEVGREGNLKSQARLGLPVVHVKDRVITEVRPSVSSQVDHVNQGSDLSQKFTQSISGIDQGVKD